jgi:hypothetical protein
MTDNELIKILNKLHEIKPDAEWKASNRELLFSQIFHGQNLSGEENDILARGRSVWKNFTDYFDVYILGNLSKVLARPTLTVVLIVVIALGTGVFGVQYSRSTKPGDSLYIAKIVSEKTQLAFTFGEKEKAQLEISFATNRTQEISEIVNENLENKDDQVVKLTEDFKREINSTRQRLQKITQNAPASNDKGISQTDKNSATTSKKIAAPGKDSKDIKNKDNEVFSANSGKDDKRIEISEPSKTLDEAEKLFDSKNYQQTIDKLNEVNTILDESKDSSKAADFTNATTDATTTN